MHDLKKNEKTAATAGFDRVQGCVCYYHVVHEASDLWP